MLGGWSDNLGCLADGSVWLGTVWVGLGGVQSAGCLAFGFLVSWKVEVVEVWGPGAAGPEEMEWQAGDRGGGKRLAQARQRGRVSGARGLKACVVAGCPAATVLLGSSGSEKSTNPAEMR